MSTFAIENIEIISYSGCITTIYFVVNLKNVKKIKGFLINVSIISCNTNNYFVLKYEFLLSSYLRFYNNGFILNSYFCYQLKI